MCIPPIVARQRLGKHVPAATNTQATIEVLLDASFSMRSVGWKQNRVVVIPRIYCISQCKIAAFPNYLTFDEVSLRRNVTKQLEHKTGSEYESAVSSFTAKILTLVSRNTVSRIDECIQNNGGHAQNVLRALVYVLCSVSYNAQCFLFGF
jgi:hypothetical protein